MDFRNRRAIHHAAANALNRAGEDSKKLFLCYSGTITALSLLSLVVSYVLDLRIAETGGLSNMGLRSILSTVQHILPIAQIIISTCLGFSYQQNVLSMARGQGADYRTLPGGFRHFFLLVRLTLLQGLIYFAVGFVAMQLSSIIFTFTPFAQAYYEAVEPLVNSMSVMGTVPALDEATTAAILNACMPAVWIFIGVLLILIVPVYFRYRMSMFCLADEPRMGAFLAMHKSRLMLRKRCFDLLKLDFTMWWFYVLQVLISLVLYSDMLLPILGVQLPWSQNASAYLFNGFAVLIQFAVYYFTLNRVNVTYAVAYDTLQQPVQPEQPAQPNKPFPFQTEF